MSCAQPTDSTDDGVVEREHVEVFGPISEDAVWESGKEYYVTGDVTVETGATLTILPACSRQADRCNAQAGGGDSTTAILFTSGAAEWARKPGDWRGIEASP